MNEHEVMTLLNNAVFVTEDLHDKAAELVDNYNFADFTYVSLHLEEEDCTYLKRLLSDCPNIHYVIGLSEIDDKLSKLIIRKVK
jgi:hypothetical protein|nr:MAG TPA: hypothetical protein [Caudoviricetes sp.]